MILDFTTVINLSHPISEEMPHWPGDPKTKIQHIADVAQDGYNLKQVVIGEHSGTHLGAPSHFLISGHSVDQIPVQHLFAPAVVFDIHEHAKINRDYLLSVDDIVLWEQQFGRIENQSIAVVNTGWFRFWENEAIYLGTARDGKHFPGVSLSAAHFLVQERKILGLGIDTAGVDGGQSKDFAANILLAAHSVYHLENLYLAQLQAPRLFLAVGALAIKNGNGSPCRVLGLV